MTRRASTVFSPCSCGQCGMTRTHHQRDDVAQPERDHQDHEDDIAGKAVSRFAFSYRLATVSDSVSTHRFRMTSIRLVAASIPRHSNPAAKKHLRTNRILFISKGKGRLFGQLS